MAQGTLMQHWMMIWVIIASSLMLTEVEEILASVGDQSNEYQGCYSLCHFHNCTSGKDLLHFTRAQGFWERQLWWSCKDECKYQCMWTTTHTFLRRGWKVPQFHGKWPFKRFLGLQEPASVLFSALNLLAHVYSLLRFHVRVPPEAPLYFFWHIYSAVCINAWFWSAVFHARDTGFTEKMDYFCAFSMVLFSFFALVFRLSGKENYRYKCVWASSCLLFYLYHIWYLSSRSFNYGYNMKVNIVVGFLNAVGWILWSWRRLSTRPYVFWCLVTVVCVVMSTLLELLDFFPIWWCLDAHAIWHLATAPLPYYWFRFVEGDCLYLLRSAQSDYRKVV